MSASDGIRVAYVTAGGAGMFCGSCMRDNTLARSLIDMGHDVVLMPTFTPIRTDEDDVSIDRVFLGGINLYLEDRWSWFRRLPGFTRHWLDRPGVLRLASKMTLQREAAADGRLALSLLSGAAGPHRKEIEELTDWLANELKPDVVNLTNLLIAGFVPELKQRLDVPVFVTLQGDDIFLDTLLTADRERVIGEMRRVARSVDGFIVFSKFYRDEMAEMFDIPLDRFHLAPMGLSGAKDFHVPDAPRKHPPTIGYLARICEEKGFDLLAEAFVELREQPGMEHARLKVAGWLNASDVGYFEKWQQRIAAAGLLDDFQRVDVPDRADKIRFLSGIDVFSVPTRYHEPKGIYVLEALAAGVPVVQPAHGAFPELLEHTGGGILVPPEDPSALADALYRLLRDDAARAKLADEGRRHILDDFSAEAMARETLKIWQSSLR